MEGRDKGLMDDWPNEGEGEVTLSEFMFVVMKSHSELERRIVALEHACERDLAFVKCICGHRKCDHYEDKNNCLFAHCSCQEFGPHHEQD